MVVLGEPSKGPFAERLLAVMDALVKLDKPRPRTVILAKVNPINAKKVGEISPQILIAISRLRTT